MKMANERMLGLEERLWSLECQAFRERSRRQQLAGRLRVALSALRELRAGRSSRKAGAFPNSKRRSATSA